MSKDEKGLILANKTKLYKKLYKINGRKRLLIVCTYYKMQVENLISVKNLSFKKIF